MMVGVSGMDQAKLEANINSVKCYRRHKNIKLLLLGVSVKYHK